MDDQVLRSLMKWPNVPDCFGWLALDRRGQWRMRDEFTQQNKLPGQVIKHAALNEFIARNYACDELGRYFFQNGPQRVFISLDATPWIVRITPGNLGSTLTNQCNQIMEPSAALSDEKGNIYIVGTVNQTIYDSTHSDRNNNTQFIKREDQTIALLHDHDLDYFSELAKLREEACSFGGSWVWQDKQLPLDPVHSDELAPRFKFIANPLPPNS
jgi:superfamily I DNA/RNA helicase